MICIRVSHDDDWRRLLQKSSGKAELAGHYNILKKEFELDNEGLTVVSNLFLFPYIQTFKTGFRSPHSSVILMPGTTKDTVRFYHLAGINEKLSVITKDSEITEIHKSGDDEKNGNIIKFAFDKGEQGCRSDR